MGPRPATAEVARLAARRAVKEICDTPTAGQSGIIADRAGSFRWDRLRQSSHKDLRHLSSSEGVAAALQFESPTPRSLSYGRAPTTLQAFDEAATPRRPSSRPVTPREVRTEVDLTASLEPLAPYLTDRPSRSASRPRTLLSSADEALTLRAHSVTKPRPWHDEDAKPSMARRGTAPRMRPATPREGYSMMPAGLPSPGHKVVPTVWAGRGSRACSEERAASSPSSNGTCPERHGTWADLVAEAQELGAALIGERGAHARLRAEVQFARARPRAGEPSSPRRGGAMLTRGTGWSCEAKDQTFEEVHASACVPHGPAWGTPRFFHSLPERRITPLQAGGPVDRMEVLSLCRAQEAPC
ncbi:unnamed protein product [Effrenium voratum]|nr:unnamed protein product [Effrenium voratum]